MNPAVLTTALTGPLAKKADNAALPTTPGEIAAAAKEAYDAGAAVVHVHLRDEDQRPTADLDTGRRVLEAIEETCPVLIQLSTGVGIGVELEERVAARGAQAADGHAQRVLDDVWSPASSATRRTACGGLPTAWASWE